MFTREPYFRALWQPLKKFSMKDLLILEDNSVQRLVSELWAKKYGLTYVSFESGLAALEYLNSLNHHELPDAYLIDMKIGVSQEELETPLKIFHLLKDRKRLENFAFYTAHLSEYDLHVKETTGMPIFVKNKREAIFNFLEGVANQKSLLELKKAGP